MTTEAKSDVWDFLVAACIVVAMFIGFYWLFRAAEWMDKNKRPAVEDRMSALEQRVSDIEHKEPK